jgi:hypothetical protein
MINKNLPEDVVEVWQIVRRSKAFIIVKGELYKKIIFRVLQWCVTPQEGQAILHDIHAGVCGHHASCRAIAAKAFRAGFYWLTAVEDAKDIVCFYEACQIFASTWPGGHVYMLVAVDKFTKWIEAAPETTQDSTAAMNFIKSIVFHFGVPHSIITDNGTNLHQISSKITMEIWGSS